MTDEPSTQQMPSDPPPPRPPLRRSSRDTVIAGVAGGIGRHLNIDPLAVRITFVILTFAGGLGVIAYLACLVFMPVDDPNAPPLRWGVARTVGAALLAIAAIAILVPNWVWGPGFVVLLAAGVVLYLLIRVVRDDGASHLSTVAARIGIGIVLLALAVGGFAAAAAGSALGGGIAISGLIIACGVGLVGGAFRGGARWLIAPALVLAVPLAAVAATDLDLDGTWGDRTFRPASVEELADGYEMGVGAMRIDLREIELPPGRTVMPLDIGMGEIQVLAPRDMCVTTDATIGIGAADVGDGEQGGVDLDIEGAVPAAGVRYLHIDADIGLGAIRVGDHVQGSFDPGLWHDDGVVPGTSLAACEAPA